LHSSVLERTESDLLKINWLRGVILLIPIVLVPWGRFSLCHAPIRPISTFRDHITILIVGYVITRFVSKPASVQVWLIKLLRLRLFLIILPWNTPTVLPIRDVMLLAPRSSRFYPVEPLVNRS
jgi:hypothetical protein